ncbi:hypothetical protein AB0B20_03150 [Micromonospora sp. NPDC049151]|uniref:hypothetical protein n=1 Tax=Micromonospora sp. NPDC049151 TaxID=3155648 RepID=UPI0033E7D281
MRSAPALLRLGGMAALIGIALCTTACGSKGGDGADATPPSSGCQVPADQKTLLADLRGKALTGYVPDGTRSAGSKVFSAACTTDWPESHGALPPAKRVAAVENDYTTTNAMTAAQLLTTFGARAVADGWQANGSWDDSQGDGSAYAVYCQKISGHWSSLSIYRGPKAGGDMPLHVFVEAYPAATSCPGRPKDG